MDSTPTCPYCHQNQPDKTSIARRPPPSPDDEIAYIHTETRRIEDLIDQLRDDRITLLRRLNALQSPIRVLSPEILSLIFQHASPAPDYFQEVQDSEIVLDPFFHFVLASVSSQWRQIVHSTPNLWNSIRVVSERPDDLWKWTMALQTFFKKSGGLPLDLALYPFWNHPRYLFCASAQDTLLKNCHRIRSLCLDLDSLSGIWLSFLSKLTELVDLSIKCYRSNDKLSFSSNLHITRLRLEGAVTSDLNIDHLSTSLTVLDLCGIPVDICMTSIIRCPALVEFRCTRPSKPTDNLAASAISSPVVLAKLEFLSWTFGGFKSWDSAFLASIHAPALKTLRWVESASSNYTHAPGFLNRLPLTLETIEFAQLGRFCQHELIGHVRRETKIKRIGMKLCNNTALKNVLRALCHDANAAVAYPSLEYIQVEGLDNAEHNIDEETGPLLAQALRQRQHLVDINNFTFSTSVIRQLKWDEGVAEMFWDLIRDGIPLRIIHNREVLFDRALLENDSR